MNEYQIAARSVQHHILSRPELVKRYSWAIPDEESIRAIVGLRKPILEIGAGNGYWASLIATAGGSIECWDIEPGMHVDGGSEKLWYPVSKGGPEILGPQHRDHALMLVWPPFNTPMATDCLLQFMKAGGRSLIYVGESMGGCTGDDEFHRILGSHWEAIRHVNNPTWGGVRDRVCLYERMEDDRRQRPRGEDLP